MADTPGEHAPVALMPYLYYPDATPVLDFLVDAFGFEVLHAFRSDDGTVLTAQLRLGDAVVMIGPGMEAFGTRGVEDPRWCTMRTYVYVDDVDAHCARARAAGATIRDEPMDHVGGDRIYVVTDCGGHQWIFSQRGATTTAT
jgi:uncharacterized glyoxalase superfamily protein PhnB